MRRLWSFCSDAGELRSLRAPHRWSARQWQPDSIDISPVIFLRFRGAWAFREQGDFGSQVIVRDEMIDSGSPFGITDSGWAFKGMCHN
jgi:hypothetical protein